MRIQGTIKGMFRDDNSSLNESGMMEEFIDVFVMEQNSYSSEIEGIIINFGQRGSEIKLEGNFNDILNSKIVDVSKFNPFVGETEFRETLISYYQSIPCDIIFSIVDPETNDDECLFIKRGKGLNKEDFLIIYDNNPDDANSNVIGTITESFSVNGNLNMDYTSNDEEFNKFLAFCDNKIGFLKVKLIITE